MLWRDESAASSLTAREGGVGTLAAGLAVRSGVTVVAGTVEVSGG